MQEMQTESIHARAERRRERDMAIYLFLSIYLSTYTSFFLSTYLSVCLSIYLSGYVSIYLPTCITLTTFSGDSSAVWKLVALLRHRDRRIRLGP